MNIGMVLSDKDFPPDVRVEKEARALLDAGHQVVILAENSGGHPVEDVWYKGLVRRVPKIQGWSKRINRLRYAITFQERHWYSAIASLVRDFHLEALHVHDLPMLGTSLAVGKEYSIPVISDLHENYPAAIKYYFHAGRFSETIKHKIFYDARRWNYYETSSVSKADHVLVVVEEAKERLVNKGICTESITVIENTEDIDNFNGYPIDEVLLNRFRNDFVVSYIGGFGGEHRGLDTAIAAMPEILQSIPNALLLLVGNGTIKPRLEQMTAELSLGDRVCFIDWQPFEKVPTFIELSAVCLVPHQSNPHTEATSPHKLFQYMLLKKPVIVSSCKPLKRVIEETKAGLVFEAGNRSDLAKEVIRLKDEELRRELGVNGQQAVYKKYNWSRTSQDLLAVYERLEKRR